MVRLHSRAPKIMNKGVSMPTYEYQCNKCGYLFSITGAYSSLMGIVPVCPSCKSNKVYKKLFPTPIIYKGKGFTKAVKEKNE